MAERCLECMRLKEQEGPCPFCGFDGKKSEADTVLPMGTVLVEQYLIGRVLDADEGGFTYLAWDQYLDMPVEIKEYYPAVFVRRDNSNSLEVQAIDERSQAIFSNMKERFLREAQLLAQFRNLPVLAAVKTFFQANNTTYMVMEHLEGKNLREYVTQEGERKMEVVLERMRPIVEALIEMHKRGVLHRNIIPDSIRVLEDGTLKLTDFGAVKVNGLSAAERIQYDSGPLSIAPGFVPPEGYQISGKLGTWSDVYSLCATIYYWISGGVVPEALERLVGEEIPSFAQLKIQDAIGVEAVLMKGMALRAVNRFQDMEALYRALYRETGVMSKVETTENTAQILDAAEAQKDKKEAGKKMYFWLLATVVCVVLAVIIGFLGAGEQKQGEDQPGTEVSQQAVSKPLPHQSSNQTQKEPNQGSTKEQILHGLCGDQVSFGLDLTTGELVLEGSGETWSFKAAADGEKAQEEAGRFMPSPWEDHLEDVKNVVVKEGITTIGDSMFRDCINLYRVELPESLERMAGNAFEGIGREQLRFYGKTGSVAEEFALENKVPFVSTGFAQGYIVEGQCGEEVYWTLELDTGHLALSGSGHTWNYVGGMDPWGDDPNTREGWPQWREYKKHIVSLEIGPDITWLGTSLFEDCVNMETVDWGRIEGVAVNTFRNSGLVTVQLPETMSVLEDYSFSYCSKLTEMVLPENITYLGGAFYECYNLRKLVIKGYYEVNGNEENGNSIFIEPFGGEGCPLVTIYGYQGSAAEQYALEQGIPFLYISQ